MSTDLTVVQDHTPVIQLKNKFQRRGIHHILVEDEAQQLMGIISTEDLLRTAHFPVNEDQLLARHIMTAKPTTVSQDLSVQSAIEIFLDNYFRALPVINEQEKLVGIITPYDILARLAGRTTAQNYSI